jgi:hypothetical protein
VPIVLYLNLYRFWYQLPRRFGTPTNETVVVRLYQGPQCRGRNVLIIAKDPLALLAKVFASYRVHPMPTFMYYPTAMALVGPEARPGAATVAPDVGTPDCIIVQPTSVPGQSQAVLAGIPRRFPGFVGLEYHDPSGNRVSFLFTRPTGGSAQTDGAPAPENARNSP